MISARVFHRSLSTYSPRLSSYGFIGLGQMGQHMARHIYNKLDTDDKLYVHDVVPSLAQTFVQTATAENNDNSSKLKKLDTLSSFVTEVDKPLDFIITMVPEGKHVEGVVGELLDAYKTNDALRNTSGTTILDSSTIDIPTSVKVHEMTKNANLGIDFIDTPVSGGVIGARRGTLSFMLSREDHDSIKPELVKLLKLMGANIFPCGNQHGTGLAAKLSNNYLLAITNLAVADSFQLAKAFGLNLQNYAKLVAVSTGKSWASVDNCPIPGVYPENGLPCEVGYEGGFITKLTRKDLVLATQSAKSKNRYLFLGDLGKQWYDKACERDHLANRDLAVLYEWLGEIEETQDGKIKDKVGEVKQV